MESFINITSSFWFQAIIKLVLGFILAGIIGLERSSWNKPAGFRTHSLVGLSAVLIMLCGEYMSKEYNIDPSRIPAQLLSGIGFVGAGTILRDGFNVKGLTTAAGLLAVTCVGLSIGAGFYLGGIITTLIAYIILSYSYKLSDKLDHFGELELQITTNKNENEILDKIEKCLSNFEVEIKQIKRQNKEDTEGEVIKINAHYNKKEIKKNEILKSITLIENVREVKES